ncbi:MAG: HAD-IC family P-type ATPase, partial [Actinobacteria bacterium]|nr:HAD-IC family P-type ATPase [Actinomycetota bacterium]
MMNGLSSQEAEERLARFGPNALPAPRHVLLWLILRQFRGIFNILLLLAAAITFALREPIDASFILFFVFVGVSLNVYQEYKSNAAVEKLKTYLVRTITVRRDGRDQEVKTDEIVPGDILKLEAGDIVPADAVVREARELLVDETTFTGESVPVAKFAAGDGEEAGEERRLLQGVVIVRGNALAEVTATGTRTRLAAIAATASGVQEESELVKGIDRISAFILKATLITLLFVILANVVIDGGDVDLPELLIFAIALAISVIPEALPLVLTFTLSRGALRFAQQDVVVKRLASVQDLGSVNLLCTDKTGTITENRLAYAGFLQALGSRYHPLLLARLAAHGLDERNPEPFDRAVEEALTPELRAEAESFQILEEEAFDPALRCNGALAERADGSRIRVRRGSPEYFAERGLLEEDGFGGWLTAEERQGHRVLGVSYDEGDGPLFAGFVSFVDRLKESTREALDEARRLNV